MKITNKYYKSLSALIEPRNFNKNIDWSVDVFENNNPLELEIGCGNGEFITRQALENPNINFIGLDVSWGSIKRGLRKLSKIPNNNAKLMLMEAEAALSKAFTGESLTKITALFPVPWPNENHAKKRLFSTSFLNLAASRLKENGVFEIVTDSLVLANWIVQEAENSALKFELLKQESGLDTKYERKWQGEGQEVFYYFTGVKKYNPNIENFKRYKMQAYFLDDFEVENFALETIVHDDYIIKFMDINFDEKKKEALIKAVAIESGFRQDFHIKIKYLPEDKKWKVTLAIPSQVFPTEVVLRALKLAARKKERC